MSRHYISIYVLNFGVCIHSMSKFYAQFYYSLVFCLRSINENLFFFLGLMQTLSQTTA